LRLRPAGDVERRYAALQRSAVLSRCARPDRFFRSMRDSEMRKMPRKIARFGVNSNRGNVLAQRNLQIWFRPDLSTACRDNHFVWRGLCRVDGAVGGGLSLMGYCGAFQGAFEHWTAPVPASISPLLRGSVDLQVIVLQVSHGRSRRAPGATGHPGRSGCPAFERGLAGRPRHPPCVIASGD